MSQPGTVNTHPALVTYPAKAAFGRTLPKNKIYEHSKANTRLKDLFVKEVEQIVWQYKLAPETINLPARPGRAGDSGIQPPAQDARVEPRRAARHRQRRAVPDSFRAER